MMKKIVIYYKVTFSEHTTKANGVLGMIKQIFSDIY